MDEGSTAGGGFHSLALRADGTIESWGYDGSGEISSTPSGPGFTQVAGGNSRSLALRTDGSIASWGDDGWGLVSGTPTGVGFTQLARDGNHSLALRNDHSGVPFCLGDGSGFFCPCLAHGNPGEGCANSGGVGGATLMASGNAVLLSDTFQLGVAGVPGNKPGLILRGAIQINSGLGNPVGEGLLCVGGMTARSQVQVTSAGTTTFTDFQGQPFGQSSYGIGVPTNYQFWYRDTANTCSGSGFNFSNAWTVTWLP